jgi:tetratricopeptide (TPR) repeat protein
MNIKIVPTLLLTACSLLFGAVTTQAQNVATRENDLYQKGMDLFEKGLYADADAVLARAAADAASTDRLLLSDIAARRAVCAIELQLPAAEKAVNDYIGNYPENKHRHAVLFALANAFFHQKKYKKAVAWYEQVDSHALRYHQHVECLFKQGYCYFELNNYAKATNCFVEAKDAPHSSYSAPALYYLGHIEYRKGNDVSALAAFEKAMLDDRFAGQAPLYLVQIYYRQKAYEKVIATGLTVLPALDAPGDRELVRLLADAYFQLKEYDKAREYFLRYSKDQPKLSRADEYFIGLIDYHAQQYESAVPHFERVRADGADSLTQSALAHLGALYLKLDEKAKAKSAFEAASRQNFLPAVTQDAWLQYAKLSIELQQDGLPLQKYFEKYPAQVYLPELRSYSATLHILRREYEKALDDLRSLPQPTDKQQADRQRLHFLIGKKYYDTRDLSRYAEAINHFEAAHTADYNATIGALARYYQADAYYQLKQYKEAETRFEKFLTGSGAFRSGGEYIAAHYNLGYCQFKQRSYVPAISWFRKFIALSGTKNREQVSDAYNRIGDGYYTQKQYWLAAENYNKAIEMNGTGTDYALYRKALAYGLLGRYENKTKTLADIIVKYPKSIYAQAGLLELGRTHLQHNQDNDAEQSFRQLLRDYPNTSYKAQALTELGLLCANTNRTDEAIDYYKQALQEAAPHSADAKSALEGLKNAYANTNNLSLYYDYLQNTAKQEINPEEKEEALFLAAEKLVNSTSCDKAIASFTQFIADFPNSAYRTQAYFYLGNCYFQHNESQAALDAYRHVIDDPQPNPYKEQALANSGQAYIEREDYEEAVDALRALVRTTVNQEVLLATFIDIARIQSRHLFNYREAANSAQSALSISGISPAQAREMKLVKANSWNRLGQSEAAYEIYREIVEEGLNDKENAEAQYYLIELTFAQNSFEEGEKMVFDFAASPAKIYQYWIARSYIVLANQYALRGNHAQAKATYQSILTGYKNTDDDILERVRKEL